MAAGASASVAEARPRPLCAWPSGRNGRLRARRVCHGSNSSRRHGAAPSARIRLLLGFAGQRARTRGMPSRKAWSASRGMPSRTRGMPSRKAWSAFRPALRGVRRCFCASCLRRFRPPAHASVRPPAHAALAFLAASPHCRGELCGRVLPVIPKLSRRSTAALSQTHIQRIGSESYQMPA